MITFHGLQRIYPGITPQDVDLQDDADGRGAYIKRWHYHMPVPSDQQIHEASIIAEQQLVKNAAWGSVRNTRNKLLKNSDWTQIPDCSIKNKQAWAKYRQQLRDVTKNFPNPESVVWPIPPAA